MTKTKIIFKMTRTDSDEAVEDVRTFEFDSTEMTLPTLLENFEDFLKSIGYVFDGHLDIVENPND